MISTKNYNNSKYETKLSNIEKMKAELINENININNKISKQKRRYQSILITDKKDI